MNEWTWQSASAMARGIRERRIGCLELLELHLARVQRHNGALNAIVAIDADRARARAREADAALASGAAVGPLHGVPMENRLNAQNSSFTLTNLSMRITRPRPHVFQGPRCATFRLDTAVGYTGRSDLGSLPKKRKCQGSSIVLRA